MLVLADENQILRIYPYRDSDHAKITEQTRNLLIVGYGAPRIIETQLKDALETTISYIKQVSDGKTETTKVFSQIPK
jgi:DNA/RNA-binding domain of Phe-tRNA-synthetase-like protein